MMKQLIGADALPTIPLVTIGFYYTTPNQKSSCVCNTVYFSLMSACAACQGGGIEGFVSPHAMDNFLTANVIYNSFQFWNLSCPRVWIRE